LQDITFALRNHSFLSSILPTSVYMFAFPH